MSETLLEEKLDLTNCEKEPIRIPGFIQPHGILFVLQVPELTILQASTNVFDFFGLRAQALLNKNLNTVLEQSQVDFLKQCLLSEDLQEVNPLKLKVKSTDKEMSFDGIVHRIDSVLLLELEDASLSENTPSLRLYNVIKEAIGKLQKAPNLHNLCKIAAEEVRKITSFDHVMVYQFDKDWNGTVIAEAKRADAEPFLTLRFPASDIPRQARELYLQNWLRLIANVDYQPAAIVPVNNPVTGGPLDLSFSVLRSVSPLHLEYLKNMGIGASMSVSLIVENKLWGLLVCHHNSQNYLPHTVRKACEVLGQVVSSLISSKEDYDDYVYEWKVKTIQASLIGNIPREESIVDGLAKYGTNLMEIVSAKGVAIHYVGNYVSVGSVRRYVSLGETPAEEDVMLLIEWLKNTVTDEVFFTDSLPSLYAEAERFKHIASGLLAIAIAKSAGNYVLWFRPEVIQTVNWGGDPSKSVIVEENDKRLHPRKSFELWKQTIRLTSLSWKPSEVQAATKLRSVVADMALRDTILKKRLRAWFEH